jgi:hypothetical protein
MVLRNYGRTILYHTIIRFAYGSGVFSKPRLEKAILLWLRFHCRIQWNHPISLICL